jgi:trimethyllysine dioxygenase
MENNFYRMMFNVSRYFLWRTPMLKRRLGVHAVVPRIAVQNDPFHYRLVSISPTSVRVSWAEKLTSTFHNIWLRDHCQCEQCLHPQTKQRLINTFQIPSDIKSTAIEQSKDGLTIQWNHQEHRSFYEWSWLFRHSYYPRLQRTFPLVKQLWNCDIQQALPAVEYNTVMKSDDGVADWTAKIEKYGFCFVNGVPVNPESTEKLLCRIAFIRTTHYGKFWDFTSNLAKADLAYTTMKLDAHTDTTYFTDPVGLQLLHLLEFDGVGGESLLVDGFRAARILREEDPTAYRILSHIGIPSHSAGNNDIFIQPSTTNPILTHNLNTGQLEQIRWNNSDRSTMDQWNNADDVPLFYDAIRKWNEILSRKDSELWTQLRPGRALIFDNWRVLHGRSAFSGHRRLCGGYINRDDYVSRLRLTNLGRDGILKTIF